MKKISVVLLVIISTAVLALSGCSGNNTKTELNDGGTSTKTNNSNNGTNETKPSNFNETGYPIVNEPVTLKIMGPKHAVQAPWKEMTFFQDMNKQTNINFEFDTPTGEAYAERKNLAFASDQLPDIFFGYALNTAEEVKYGSEGKLIPLEGLIEKYAPNIQAMFEAMPEVKKSITAPDGHIYSLPSINRAPVAIYNPVWVNGDWLNKLGITELPTTTEGFYELLKKFKEGSPGGADGVPFMSWLGGGDLAWFLMPAFGHLSAGTEYLDGKVQYGALSDGYKAYLKFVNRLWSEKLINQDMYNVGFTELSARGKENKFGMGYMCCANVLYEVVKPEEILKHKVLPALTSELNATPMYPSGTGITTGVFAITSKNKFPEASIRWVDYLYSEEGSIFVQYGPEGTTWEYADTEKKVRKSIPAAEGEDVSQRQGKLTPDAGYPAPKWTRDDTEKGWDDVMNQHRYAEIDGKLTKAAKVPYPLIYNTDEEQERLSVLGTDINKYQSEMEAKFITGQLSIDENWDKFVSTLKKMGVDEIVDIATQAYERWETAK